jgi:hypothetical protein
MRRSRLISPFLLVLALQVGQPAAANAAETVCKLPNAAGSVADRAASPGAAAGESQKQKKGGKRHRKKPAAPKKVTLQAEAASANKVVNLGDDREAEEVTLHASVSPRAPAGFERRLAVVAEQFANTSETGETVTFAEPTFSKPKLAGNGKRVTFTMCIDAPNDLPAGKYTTAVTLEGPPSSEPAVMTVTLNAKDGHGFIIAAVVTLVLSILILLYKSAGERRAVKIAEAEAELTDARGAESAKTKLATAKRWRCSIWECVGDLGWWVPTLAAVVTAFTALSAAYAANPAWGEGGLISSAIALIGTGLAAIGAKAVFTQSS